MDLHGQTAGGLNGYVASAFSQCSTRYRMTPALTVLASSTGSCPPNSATRSPDAASILRVRRSRVDDASKNRVLLLAPDVILGVFLPGDVEERLARQMLRHTANRQRLGWLYRPATRGVHIYRPGVLPRTLAAPPR